MDRGMSVSRLARTSLIDRTLDKAFDYVDELNRELELVEEDEFAKLFPDCEPGAIPPLGPAYNIETFLDEALKSLANIYFESGDHEHLIHTSGEDFKKLLSGVRHGHFSHES